VRALVKGHGDALVAVDHQHGGKIQEVSEGLLGLGALVFGTSSSIKVKYESEITMTKPSISSRTAAERRYKSLVLNEALQLGEFISGPRTKTGLQRTLTTWTCLGRFPNRYRLLETDSTRTFDFIPRQKVLRFHRYQLTSQNVLLMRMIALFLLICQFARYDMVIYG
jgi:hypothetical protein